MNQNGFAPVLLLIVGGVIVLGLIIFVAIPLLTINPQKLLDKAKVAPSGNSTDLSQFKKRQIDLSEMKKGMFGKGYPEEVTSIPDEQLVGLSCNVIHNTKRRSDQEYDFASKLPSNLTSFFPMMKNSRVKDSYGIVGIIDDVVYCTTEDNRSLVVITNYTNDGEGSGDDVYFWQSQNNKQPSLLGSITAIKENDRFDCSGPGPLELTKQNVFYYKCDYVSGAGYLSHNESVFKISLSPFFASPLKNCWVTDNPQYPGVSCK